MIWTASYNGLALGTGTNFPIRDWVGFDDLPPIDSSDIQRANENGEWLGFDLSHGREVELSLVMKAVDAATLDSQILQVVDAFPVQFSSELPFIYNNGTRVLYARPRKRQIDRDYKLMFGNTTLAHLALHATDPRIYSYPALPVVINLLGGAGGGQFNALFNYEFGSGGYGAIQLTNIGNAIDTPALTIVGPVSNPTFGNVVTGQTMLIHTTLGSHDSLVVDLNARTIILNGTTSLRSSLDVTSQWFGLIPGLNEIFFSGSSPYNPFTELSFDFQSAWI